jgi:hypothetical protein
VRAVLFEEFVLRDVEMDELSAGRGEHGSRFSKFADAGEEDGQVLDGPLGGD